MADHVEAFVTVAWGLYCVFLFWCCWQLVSYTLDYRADMTVQRKMEEREKEWQNLRDKVR